MACYRSISLRGNKSLHAIGFHQDIENNLTPRNTPNDNTRKPGCSTILLILAICFAMLFITSIVLVPIEPVDPNIEIVCLNPMYFILIKNIVLKIEQ